jgi:hypothetical protein
LSDGGGSDPAAGLTEAGLVFGDRGDAAFAELAVVE